jgi:uncharacterized protein (TIGR00661 family)
MELFEPCTLFRGFTGIATGGKIRKARTVAQLKITRFFQDARAFDASGFDLAITDFEPVTGWIARRHGLPSIGLGHLYAYCYPLPLPLRSLPARLLLRTFVPIYTPVRTFLGINWHHFGNPVLPPTIPEDLRPDREVRPGKVLVYLPAESEEAITARMKPLGDYEFFVYRSGGGSRDDGNVHFRGHDRQGFLADLFESEAVVANGGFSLASEALHLGKKVLLQPIRGQPEQYLNGKILTRLGLGTVARRPGFETIRTWLKSPAPPPMSYPDVVRPFAEWIDEGNWNRPEELARRVWSGMTWPNQSSSSKPRREPPSPTRQSTAR